MAPSQGLSAVTISGPVFCGRPAATRSPKGVPSKVSIWSFNLCAEFAECLLGDLPEQVLLAGEVVEEGLVGDVDPVADVGHLGSRKASFDKEFRRGADNAGASFEFSAFPASEIRGGLHEPILDKYSTPVQDGSCV